MPRGQDFDCWWDNHFGFSKLGNPLYGILRKACDAGANPEFVHQLLKYFQYLNTPLVQTRRSKVPRRTGIDGSRIVELFEPVYRQFGFWVYLDTLQEMERIRNEFLSDATALAEAKSANKQFSYPGKSLISMVQIGAEVVERAINRAKNDVQTASLKTTEKRRKELQDIEASIRAAPLGDVVFEYAFKPIKATGGRPSATWETFILLALTEHLRKATGKPNYLMATRLLKSATRKETKSGRLESRATKERIRKLKKDHPTWKKKLTKLNDYLAIQIVASTPQSQ